MYLCMGFWQIHPLLGSLFSKKTYNMAWIAGFLLRIFGWKVETEDIHLVKKAVLVMAPHTSNWDFIIGRLALLSRNVPVKTLMKKEMFVFPISYILKALGTIPLDRIKSPSTIKSVTSHFAKSDNLLLMITPEGTRKLNKHWKKGFYFIAQASNAPLLLGFLDYKNKVAGIGPTIVPTGNYEEDLMKIEHFYKDKTARYPEKFNLSPIYRHDTNKTEVG
ncbi:MAG TPA: acyltransferase [Bacteroidales bacterium]|nr:acyltransferase [Bacteroidales bacterium]